MTLFRISYLEFASPQPQSHISDMTQKRLVLETISELPDEVSLEEIAERIEFLAAVQKGIDQLDRGEGIPHEEVKRQLATWLAR
jgi:predicted transcriptional regulator